MSGEDDAAGGQDVSERETPSGQCLTLKAVSPLDFACSQIKTGTKFRCQTEVMNSYHMEIV